MYDGPDLTLLDEATSTLILIESKAKQISTSSRLEPASEAFLDNLRRIFTTLKKLRGKIESLFSRLPEYSSYWDLLDKVTQNAPICVVVVNEGILFMQEALNYHLKRNPNHFLNNYPYPYCIMELKEFELAVEIAATGQAPLYTLLHEYWQDAQNYGGPGAFADDFRGRISDHRNWFSKKYADLLLKDFGID